MRVRSTSVACLAAGVALVVVAGCNQPATSDLVGNTQRATEIREALLAGGDAGEGGATEVANPTGWAKLSGTFKVSGTPPENPILTITSDNAVCQPGGAPVRSPVVVVGPDGGLADTLIYIRKIPDSWLHEDAKKVAPEPLVYDQKKCEFLLPVAAVNANREMTLKNSDPVGHNTAITGFANPLLQAGGSFPFSFNGKTKSVPIRVSCSIHPWMEAFILPVGNNYFAVTGKDGKFAIDNLPAGVPLEFQVWQRATGGLEGVEITNPNVKWGKKGRFVVTLQPDADEVLDVTVPAEVFN
ncbi:MAG: hypothetical protein MI757_09400 [Pirellulales bacterium]|nr:hypothetical protein [Pirellulales bacterium]